MEREVLSRHPLYVFSLEEGLFLKVRIALLCGVALSSPIVLATIYFSSKTWKRHSRILTLSLVPFVFLFCVGVAFGYLVLLPTMLSFFVGETLLVAEAQMNLSSAVDLIVVTLLVFGVSFEFPLISSLLSHLRIVRPQTFLKYWRHAVVLYFVGVACARIFSG